MTKRLLVLFLIAYVSLAVIYSSQKTVLLDPDGASRGAFAVMLKGITANKAGALNTIVKYNFRYQVGLEPVFQWAPLQVLCLYLISIMTSHYQAAFSLMNLPLFLLLILYTYKLTKLLFGEERLAVFACLVLALHPIVFDTVFSLRRGLGEAAFVMISSYYLVIFLKRKELGTLFSALIFLLVGFLYRESVIMPTLTFLLFIAFISTRKSYAHVFLNKNLFAHKGKIAATAILAALIFLYILIQIPLTAKGVGTLFTKGANYKQWNAGKFDTKGLVTMDDYFSVMSVYPVLRFDKAALENLSRNNKILYAKVKLIESRFSLPLHKKAFFILSTIFYQWYLLPFFICGILMSGRMCLIKYAVIFLSSVFAGYFIFLSKTGTIPDFNLPMIPIVAICSSAGFFALSRILSRSLYNILALFILSTCIAHTAYAEKAIVLHQKIDMPPSRVIEYLKRDNAGRKPFTALLDSYVVPIYSLAAAELDRDGIIYLRPVILETANGTVLSQYIKKGGFKRRTNLLGEAVYPETRYILALSMEQLRHYESLVFPGRLPFHIHEVMSAGSGTAYEYIYIRSRD